MLKPSLFVAIVMLVSAGFSSAEETAADTDIMVMQAQMQAYIDSNLIDGALLNLNEKTGKVRLLYPAKAHPKVMSLGQYFVLCADFRDEKGKDVNVNFFIAREGDRVVVFHTSYGHDENLERLVKKGAAKTIN